ncbi:hypothetical protein MMC22_002689 [Lobaria immixta]|nr:hypothetical protein [Lobaria immixta]
MSNENSPPPTPTTSSARRASFSPGQKLSELFGRSPNNNGGGPPLYPSPITTAAANAQAQQRRRMSITSLGLSGSPTQSSAFAQARARQDSVSSGGSPSTSIDENAVEDGDAAPSGSPTSPFARRMSFGARALRDVKTGTGNVNGRVSMNSASCPPVKGRVLSSSHTSTSEIFGKVSNHSAKRSGEGFNWSEQLRSRAERSSSAAGPLASPPGVSPGHHQNTTSAAPVEPPIKEMPKGPKVPDHFQERILKGDFYMD